MGPFQNGLAKVTKIEEGAKLRGLVDTNGVEVIPCRYEEYRSFSEGLVAVRKGRFWGFANEDWELVIPCAYHNVGDFQDGQTKVYHDGAHFILDAKGQRID